MPKDDLSAKQIMKALNIVESDKQVYDLLIGFLQDAYTRGYDKAFKEYAKYGEDMGQ